MIADKRGKNSEGRNRMHALSQPSEKVRQEQSQGRAGLENITLAERSAGLDISRILESLRPSLTES